MKVAAALLGSIMLLGIPGAAAAEWSLDLEAGMRHDSNLGNAQAAADIVGDSALATVITAGQRIQLNDSDSLILQGQLRDESFNRFHGMSNLSLGASLALKQKFGLGPFAPWLQWQVSSARLAYRDEVRDGWLHQASLHAGQRITAQWELGAELLLEKRRADHARIAEPGISGAAFDQASKSLAFNADYACGDRVFLSMDYRLRHGDVVTTMGDYDALYAVAKAATPDPALGQNVFAYQLTGTTASLRAGIGIALSRQFLLSIDFQRLVTHAGGDNNYFKSLSTAKVSYAF